MNPSNNLRSIEREKQRMGYTLSPYLGELEVLILLNRGEEKSSQLLMIHASETKRLRKFTKRLLPKGLEFNSLIITRTNHPANILKRSPTKAKRDLAKVLDIIRILAQ